MPVDTNITLSAPYILVSQVGASGVAAPPTGQTSTSYAFVKQINSSTTLYAEDDLITYKVTSTSRTFIIASVQYELIDEADILFKEVTPP